MRNVSAKVFVKFTTQKPPPTRYVIPMVAALGVLTFKLGGKQVELYIHALWNSNGSHFEG